MFCNQAVDVYLIMIHLTEPTTLNEPVNRPASGEINQNMMGCEAPAAIERV